MLYTDHPQNPVLKRPHLTPLDKRVPAMPEFPQLPDGFYWEVSHNSRGEAFVAIVDEDGWISGAYMVGEASLLEAAIECAKTFLAKYGCFLPPLWLDVDGKQ